MLSPAFNKKIFIRDPNFILPVKKDILINQIFTKSKSKN